MQEGSMLVHLDANLNDYPGFVKANQWEWEEKFHWIAGNGPAASSRAGRRNKGSGTLGDFVKRRVLNGGYFPSA